MQSISRRDMKTAWMDLRVNHAVAQAQRQKPQHQPGCMPVLQLEDAASSFADNFCMQSKLNIPSHGLSDSLCKSFSQVTEL